MSAKTVILALWNVISHPPRSAEGLVAFSIVSSGERGGGDGKGGGGDGEDGE